VCDRDPYLNLNLNPVLRFSGLVLTCINSLTYFVAQIFNLLYRRFVIGRSPDSFVRACKCGSPAECNSAIQQIANQRYVSVSVPSGT
jgi:hypothetical protein